MHLCFVWLCSQQQQYIPGMWKVFIFRFEIFLLMLGLDLLPDPHSVGAGAVKWCGSDSFFFELMFNKKNVFQTCAKSSTAASFLRGSRLRLRVKILMQLWRLRSRITFSPGVFMLLRNTCFFWIVLCWTSGLAPELHFFTALAAVKGCGSSFNLSVPVPAQYRYCMAKT
jgi:hypothetical protein